MKKYIIIVLTILLVIQSGCVSWDKEDFSENRVEEEIIQVSGENQEIINRSEDISDSVVELFGIDDAVTLLFNDIALVGIVVAYDQIMDEDMIDSINFVVKEKDSQVQEVKISQNEKVFEQLNNIMFELFNNKPYEGMILEIDELMKIIDKEK